VNGVPASGIEISADARRITTETTFKEGEKVIVSGVKYPRLFPSYSFTFATVN
jgi:hypothetical protein